MLETGGQKYVGAIENGVRILRYMVSAGSPEGVATIARATGINTSTAFNILRTLANEQLISFDPDTKTYELSIGLLEFSLPLLGQSPSELIRPQMAEFVVEHRVVVALWRFARSDRIILQTKVVPKDVVRIELKDNSRLPAYVGAIGRCYAAIANEKQEVLREKYKGLIWAKDPGFDTYLKDVKAAAKNGYALDFGNLFQSTNTAAAIICDAQGKAVLGMSAIALAGKITKKEMRDIGCDLRDRCQHIQKLLFSG